MRRGGLEEAAEAVREGPGRFGEVLFGAEETQAVKCRQSHGVTRRAADFLQDTAGGNSAFLAERRKAERLARRLLEPRDQLCHQLAGLVEMRAIEVGFVEIDQSLHQKGVVVEKDRIACPARSVAAALGVLWLLAEPGVTAWLPAWVADGVAAVAERAELARTSVTSPTK